jgi:1-acyl-sn-glycerol-3-phosphate acyltransferase
VRDVYFRAEVRGLERVPDEPSMLVGNHDGGYLPVDGLCLGMSWHEHFGFSRPLYWMVHDLLFRVSRRLRAVLEVHGGLRASRHNADRAFDHGHSVFVYPGGDREAFRPFRERRTIDLGERTGFVAAALIRRVPIVPVVSVGAHETLFVLSRGKWLAQRLGLKRSLRAEVLPLWAGLPWGIGFGPMPHLPLPAKIQIEALEPIRLWEELGGNTDASDPRVLRAGFDLVRTRMQAASNRLYDARRWPVFG